MLKRNDTKASQEGWINVLGLYIKIKIKTCHVGEL